MRTPELRKRNAEYMRRWRAENPEKARERNRKEYHRNKSKRTVRARQLRRLYGISLADFEAMLEAQENRCAICSSDQPGGVGDWHVDHDHATKEVRGLLCNNCNSGLGRFKDDPVRLRKAAWYLERHQIKQLM